MSLTSAERGLLDLINRCLREGSTIEIDRLGRFRLENDEVVFEPNGAIRVFLAYAQEDRAQVKRLYHALQNAGLEPWMDCEKLLPGQNWPRAIERAIDLSDFFIGCFSHGSSAKTGHFQCELRYALDLAGRVPLDDVFLIPARLEDCRLPTHIAKHVEYVDLFPDWEHGVNRLVKTMTRHLAQRERRQKLSK